MSVEIVGTSSSCGKSIIVLCLCRYFKRKRLKVAPFKPQNMSLNSYVTKFGEEIAYIQHVQAIACEIDSFAYINPILLKPIEQNLTEVILLGRPYTITKPGRYYKDQVYTLLFEIVKTSYINLKKVFDIVVIEGAGSCAEPNLLKYDIANLKIAKEFNIPAILVTDIDRGGAFSSIIGTLMILPKSYKKLIKGFIINKFRGDVKILEPAIKWLENKTNRKVFGVLPYDEIFKLFPEDSMEIENWYRGYVDVAIVAYPGISNFNEFQILKLIPEITIRYVRRPEEFGEPDIVVLPGSRNVFKSLEYLRKTKLDKKILKFIGSGVLIGICGGFQILSKRIIDETGFECGIPIHANGLRLLNVEFRYVKEKLLSRTLGKVIESDLVNECYVQGYEIRRGRHIYVNDARPFIQVLKRNQQEIRDLEGCVDSKNMVIGTNLHEILLNIELLNQLLKQLGKKISIINLREEIIRKIDEMTIKFIQHVDIEAIEKLINND